MVAGGMLPTFDDVDEFGENGQQQGTKATGGAHPRRLSVAGVNAQNNQPSIIYLMTVLSAMGGFLFGYDTGIVSGAMVFVRKIFNLNSLWQELVVSITILGAWILSILAGGFSERYGRKTVILWASVIFTAGSVIMGVAWSKWILLFGRLTVGCAIGLASTVVPMYIAETAPTELRGSLVTLNTCFITFGQMSAAVTAGAFSYDHENGWRWMLALAAVPATVQFFGFAFMPESPRWLIRKNRNDEALAALKRIRGNKANVLREFEKIRQNQLELLVQEERRRVQKRNMLVAIMRKTETRRALTVGCLLMAAQQLAGINTVMYYTATIIEMSGVQSQSIAVWLAVPTAAVYVLFSFCGYLLADRLGRRTLILGSLLGVILSLLLLGTGFHLTSMNGAVVTTHNMSTLELCYSKLDCASCIAEPRCGFCYDAKNLAIASCLEKNPEDATRSLGGECALEPQLVQSIQQQQTSPSDHRNNQRRGQKPVHNQQQQVATTSNFVFANHICPSMTQGISLNTWLVLAGLVLYLASFAPGMSPMPWTVNSEIYPMWARSFCFSIATSVNWIFNLLITLTFISLTELITTHGAFYMYTVIASTCWLLLFWKLPETRGRSLEDISQLFAKKGKSEDEETIDEDASPNQSTINSAVGNNNPNITGGGYGPQNLVTGAQGNAGAKSPGGNLILGHDNLGFATENSMMDHHNFNDHKHYSQHHQHQHHQQAQMTKSQPAPPSSDLVERHRSFKLSSTLNRAANLAISQPDLQQDQHYQQQQQQQQQAQPPSYQQQPQHQQLQQHHSHNPTNKFSQDSTAHLMRLSNRK